MARHKTKTKNAVPPARPRTRLAVTHLALNTLARTRTHPPARFKMTADAEPAPSGAETAATFALEGEDHTLANALRFHLNKK